MSTDNNYAFAVMWLPQFALDPPTDKEVKATFRLQSEWLCQIALMAIAAQWKLLDENLTDVEAGPLLVQPGTSDQAWVSTESGLHRALASKLLAMYGRTAKSRCGVTSKLKGLG